MAEHNGTKQKEATTVTIAREDRWWDIYSAVVGGGRYHDIANAMGIGTATVTRAVDWCMAETAKTRGGPASERLRNLYNDRYERLFLSVFTNAINGDVDALDRCIRLLSSLRKMNGADGFKTAQSIIKGDKSEYGAALTQEEYTKAEPKSAGTTDAAPDMPSAASTQ